MKTVVLAGGLGTRLRSVVKTLPKPMAPVHGQYFLDYLLDGLKKNGLKDFIFCLHYLAEKIIDHWGDGSRHGITIDYSIEKTPLGTGGALGQVREKLTETFCVVNADTYLELNVPDCLEYHRKKQGLITMALSQVTDLTRYGQVHLDKAGRITRFAEKDAASGVTGYINAGFYLMEPQIIDYIPEDRVVSLETDVFPSVINSPQGLFGYPRAGNFFDIGIPQDYQRFKDWVWLRGQEAMR